MFFYILRIIKYFANKEIIWDYGYQGYDYTSISVPSKTTPEP